MKVLEKRFPDYVNGRFVGYYYECYGFRRQGETLIINHWSHNSKNNYNRTLSIRTYEDTDEGRAKANEVYKRLRADGYEVKC